MECQIDCQNVCQIECQWMGITDRKYCIFVVLNVANSLFIPLKWVCLKIGYTISSAGDSPYSLQFYKGVSHFQTPKYLIVSLSHNIINKSIGLSYLFYYVSPLSHIYIYTHHMMITRYHHNLYNLGILAGIHLPLRSLYKPQRAGIHGRPGAQGEYLIFNGSPEEVGQPCKSHGLWIEHDRTSGYIYNVSKANAIHHLGMIYFPTISSHAGTWVWLIIWLYYIT